jgi:hypothetical protein
MNTRVENLTPLQLNYAVAVAEGHTPAVYDGVVRTTMYRVFGPDLNYCTDWAQGGPIIERETIAIAKSRTDSRYKGEWMADITPLNAANIFTCGPTPLIAAMRCFVASTLGAEVDIPDDLQ